MNENKLIKMRYEKSESLKLMLETSAKEYGNKPAFKYFNEDNSIGEISFIDLNKNTCALGNAFAKLGLLGKKVAILSESRIEWIMSYLAAIIGGGVVIPLDKELMENEIAGFISFAEADAIVFSKSYIKTVNSIKDKFAPEVKLICFDKQEEEADNFLFFSDMLADGLATLDEGCAFDNVELDVNKLCAIIFTSGTTGSSKGVMLTQDNILSCIYASSNMVNFSQNDVLVSVLPLHHTYETACGILTPIRIGGTVCINNSLKYVLRNFKIFKPTGLVLVPLFVNTIYKKILDEIKKKGKEKTFNTGVKLTKAARKVKIDLRKLVFAEIIDSFGGRLTKIICGGAPLDPDMVDRFDEIGINLAQGYGITECAPLVSVNPYRALKKQSVGIPALGCDVKICGCDEEGNEIIMPLGEQGGIHVKGPNVMLGYYKNPEATKEVFDSEGYFITGDVGYMDDENYIYITGRQKNVIVLNNGKNVFPEEIEEYLLKIDIIKECVVVGRENQNGEIMLTALIYPDYTALEGKTPSEISDIIKAEVLATNKMLPIFKQIRNIEIKKNEFAKTSSQKIMRHKIQDKD